MRRADEAPLFSEPSRDLRAESRELHAAVLAARRRLEGNRSRLRRRRPGVGLVPPLRGGAGALAGARVLIVTDDPDLRDLTRSLLEWYGATAAIVPTAKAVESAGPFEPDVILVDLPFDRREAFALAARLRGRAPLVAITRHGHDHPAREAIKAGFALQISAPLDPDGFEVSLARVLTRRAA